MLHRIVKFEKLLIDQCFVSLEVNTLVPETMMFRLRGQGSGSIFISPRLDPTHAGPVWMPLIWIRSKVVRMRTEASYSVKETLVFNNESKPRFASAPVLDRISASTWDLNGSDQNWYVYSIRSRQVQIADPNLIR